NGVVRTKARQAGDAPSGLLELKSPRVGGRMSRWQWAKCQPVEKGRAVVAAVSAAFVEIAGDTPASTLGMMLILPFPKRSAVSIASTNRARFSSVIAMRS